MEVGGWGVQREEARSQQGKAAETEGELKGSRRGCKDRNGSLQSQTCTIVSLDLQFPWNSTSIQSIAQGILLNILL